MGLACVLFPDSFHWRPKKLISEQYCNWKDSVHDLVKHSIVHPGIDVQNLNAHNFRYIHRTEV